ncbi:MAG: alpha/beta hydrolase [Leptolyngbyaceae cyanobacterium bins.349]|nr:alpha/beta hydrolase [Leptolyngbyaceae cyanobacterium bins.349]
MNINLGQWLLGKSLLGVVVRSLLFVYLALNLFAFFFAERMIFLPPVPTYQDSSEILKLTTRNGKQISALYLPNPTATFTILYSHGNGSDLGTSRAVLEEIKRIGFSVFAYDYQGYGTSQGTPSEQNTYQDIDAAYAYLTQALRIPADRIILYGFSVGSGPSLDLATRQPVAGIILEGAFTSTFRVVTHWPILLLDRFRNLDKIQSIQRPILIIHGKLDRVIPFWHSQTLYQYANEPKQFFPVEEADHNNLIYAAGQQYGKTLQNFAQQIQPQP